MRFIIVIMAMILLLAPSCKKAVVQQEEVVVIQKEEFAKVFILTEKSVVSREKTNKYPGHNETIICTGTGRKIALRGECLLPKPPRFVSLVFSGSGKWACPYCCDIEGWIIE